MNYEYEEPTPYDEINLIVVAENVVKLEGLGRKINCIKTFRAVTGLGLKESKWYIDHVIREIRMEEARNAFYKILDCLNISPSEFLTDDEIKSLQYCKRIGIHFTYR